MPTSDLTVSKPGLKELIQYFDEAGGVLTKNEIKKFLEISSQDFTQKLKLKRTLVQVGPDIYRLSDIVLQQRKVRFEWGVIKRPEQYIEFTSCPPADFKTSLQRKINFLQLQQNLLPKRAGFRLHSDLTFSQDAYPCRFISCNPYDKKLIWEVGLSPKLLAHKVRMFEGYGWWEAAHKYRTLLETEVMHSIEMRDEVRHLLAQRGDHTYEVIFEGTKPTTKMMGKLLPKGAFNYTLLPAALTLSAVNIADAAKMGPDVLHATVMHESTEWTSVAIGGSIGVIAGGLAAGICTGPVIPLVIGTAFALGATEASKPVLQLLEQTTAPITAWANEQLSRKPKQQQDVPQPSKRAFNQVLSDSLAKLMDDKKQFSSRDEYQQPGDHHLRDYIAEAFYSNTETMQKKPVVQKKQTSTLLQTSTPLAARATTISPSVHLKENPLLSRTKLGYEPQIRKMTDLANSIPTSAQHYVPQWRSSRETMRHESQCFFSSNMSQSPSASQQPVAAFFAPCQQSIHRIAEDSHHTTTTMLTRVSNMGK